MEYVGQAVFLARADFTSRDGCGLPEGEEAHPKKGQAIEAWARSEVRERAGLNAAAEGVLTDFALLASDGSNVLGNLCAFANRGAGDGPQDIRIEG